MPLTICLEISDRDLEHFRKALLKARLAVRDADEADIVDATWQALEAAELVQPLPDFVHERIAPLKLLIEMLGDAEWALPKYERERLLAALVYFGDPEDLIPDDIPGIGYLDDAIMIELVLRELRHIVEAYQDFRAYRSDYAERYGDDLDEAQRNRRVAGRRKLLLARAHRRSDKESTSISF